MAKQAVLLTGGAGYIGSHTAVALEEAGFMPVLLDNFSNSQPAVLDRLEKIIGRRLMCERGDVQDSGWIQAVLQRYKISAVVHFAGFKAVGESMAEPLKYYRNNVGGTVSLLEAMQAAGCKKVVFSSSATVYGDPSHSPILEDFPRQPANCYGQTKACCEDILASLCSSDSTWRAGVLRYFNPVGAHPSGLIGDDPCGVPNNLMPYVAQVAVGRRPKLDIFGDNYATPDGTGVRDYIHVQDLALGHVAAVRSLLNGGDSFTVNLGTGCGYSVLEVVRAFEAASGRPVPCRVVARRPGDVAIYYADTAKAAKLLNWTAQLDLNDMCADAWRWQCASTGFLEDGVEANPEAGREASPVQGLSLSDAA